MLFRYTIYGAEQPSRTTKDISRFTENVTIWGIKMGAFFSGGASVWFFAHSVVIGMLIVFLSFQLIYDYLVPVMLNDQR